jgi:adenine-specific DNA-methyltransferase
MDGKSFDILSDKLNKLKEIVPEAFTEDKIDWEKLKAALCDDINFENERYNLNWAGKSDAFRVLQQRTSATLKPVPEESYPPSEMFPPGRGEGMDPFPNESENLFIEGENLEVLKVLQKSYFGKIKMIYIDPPYNTGNDSFIYPDKFSESKEEYLKRIGDKSEDGYLLKEGFFRKNSKDSGHYHSNWLSMMYPRLYIARNLLRDDGVIFVSIDDNEIHNLRMIMNEIFGEENFLAQLVWNLRSGSQAGHFTGSHEYILSFAKSKEGLKYFSDSNGGTIKHGALKKISKDNPESNITFPAGIEFEGDSAEFEEELGGSEKEYIRNSKMIFKNGKLKKPVTIGAGWAMRNQIISWLNGEETYDSKGQKVLKFYFNTQGILWYEKERGTIHPKTVLPAEVGNTKTGTDEIIKFFGKKIIDFPKPYQLIKFLIEVVCEKEDLILDFFAGSGTTAQAVLELNKEDVGNRKFILVQLPEKTAEDSEAYKAGYKTIADICKERIRRVIKNLTPAPSPAGEGLASTIDEASSYRENLFKGALPSLFEKAKQMRLVDTTEAEEKLWQILRNRQIENCKFRRQHPLYKFIADFYCHEKKLVVEVDGGYHNEKEQKEYDELRTEIINKYGIQVLRFTNEEVLNDIKNVKEKIKTALNSSHASSPLLEERGRRGEVGFGVFRLSPSNFKHWRSDLIESEEALNKMIDLFDTQLRPEAKELNMLYELILKSGYTLTDKIVEKNGFYLVSDKLAIVLSKIDQTIIDEIIKAKPQTCIILDNLFAGNDQLKTNTALQMNDAGVEMVVV